MRTREEQIAELAGLCEDAGILAPGAAYERAEDILNEAEQRVRAEIGRDSERLDWLCRNIKGDEARRIVGVISNTGCVDLWREAIDAAREGNDVRI